MDGKKCLSLLDTNRYTQLICDSLLLLFDETDRRSLRQVTRPQRLLVEALHGCMCVLL